jgi:predicted ester cyclase
VSPDEHKAIIREHRGVLFNQRRVDRTDETVAADYLDHGALPGQVPGLAGANQKWAGYLAVLPDMRATVEELVAEGDKVAVRWTVQGTQQGELLGILPTGSTSGS